MKTFSEGDIVQIINQKKRFFSMSIHRRMNPKIKYRILEATTDPLVCTACCGHPQQVKIFMHKELRWMSGMWFDSNIPRFEHTQECKDLQAEYFRDMVY